MFVNIVDNLSIRHFPKGSILGDGSVIALTVFVLSILSELLISSSSPSPNTPSPPHAHLPQDKKRIARKKKEAAEAAAAEARAAAGLSDEPDAKNMLDEVVDEDVIF